MVMYHASKHTTTVNINLNQWEVTAKDKDNNPLQYTSKAYQAGLVEGSK